jgi:two-component sensor histidine kinase
LLESQAILTIRYFPGQALSWSHELNGMLELHWTERGGPPVQTPTHEGFGGRVIRQLAEKLNGRARFDWRVEGLDCEITAQT